MEKTFLPQLPSQIRIKTQDIEPSPVLLPPKLRTCKKQQRKRKSVISISKQIPKNSAVRLPESEENSQSMYSVTAIPCRKFREELCIWAKQMIFSTCNLFANNTVHGLKIPHTYGTMILEKYLCKQFDKP